MQDKKVFIKGYMQPRPAADGDQGVHPLPQPTASVRFASPTRSAREMIRVVLQGDLETVYTNRLIGVAGKFQVDPRDPSGIPYGLEADISASRFGRSCKAIE